MDRFDRLDYADRWLSDGFRVLQENPPGFIGTVEVEMTRAQALVQEMKRRGMPGSYAALFVRAGALALARNPDTHAILVGSRRMWPGNVAIGLSVSNEAAAAPVMRLEEVENKKLPDVCAEIATRAPQVRAEDSATLEKLRRWGWLIPTGWLRRWVLRRVFSSLRARRLLGSLQVTVVPGLDVAGALAYAAPAVLGVGRIQDRVVARDGKPVVRLMATMTFTGDHKLWNGERIVRVLGEVRRIVESGELEAEVPEPAAAPVSERRLTPSVPPASASSEASGASGDGEGMAGARR